MDDRAAADEPPSPIDLTIETPAAPGRVWKTLTDPRRVAEWFTDASAVNASRWSDEVLPARLLGIGLPLAILFGWIVAYLLFDLEFWEAAVLGTMLAPTDAALGKAVVSNPGGILQLVDAAPDRMN